MTPSRVRTKLADRVAERVEWIEDDERLDAIWPDWDTLARRDPTPFAGPTWYAPWWRAFGGGRRLAMCTCWRDGTLAAVLPLFARRGRLEAMANAHSNRLRAAATDGEALAAVMKAAAESPAGVLVLHPVAAEDTRVPLQHASAAGRLALVEPALVSPIVEATDDFAAYREPRKSSWREIERRGRKLKREHNVSLDLLARPEHLEPELTEFLAVEASGWKGREGTAIASSPFTDRFYREMAEAFHARGELRLSRLYIDGRLAAADLALGYAGGYFLLKTGYDESLRRLAPGLTLRREVVERCFEMGLNHEFLGDEMDYKRLFATGYRRHERLSLYRRRPAAVGRWVYHRAARPALKRAYRRIRAAPQRRSR